MANKTRLQTIQSFYPQVRRVKDAKKPLFLDVTAKDCARGKTGKMDSCALVRAISRTEGHPALISRSVAYTIEGTTAVRFALPDTVTREIVSFDRTKTFMPGRYRLAKPFPTNQLGAVRPKHGPKRGGKDPKRGTLHRTAGVRIWHAKATG
jgi:hypothetical protein